MVVATDVCAAKVKAGVLRVAVHSCGVVAVCVHAARGIHDSTMNGGAGMWMFCGQCSALCALTASNGPGRPHGPNTQPEPNAVHWLPAYLPGHAFKRHFLFHAVKVGNVGLRSGGLSPQR